VRGAGKGVGLPGRQGELLSRGGVPTGQVVGRAFYRQGQVVCVRQG